ncbi:MAG: site-specific DNA-methyltransferase [Paludibacteraceae bacterium]|nr:site-specific DNA-methyltransferase [Paludibacteraceae bacterium]
MAKLTNERKSQLRKTIVELEGLSAEDKSALIELLNTHKKYGLVWENKPEDVEEAMRDHLPLLTEVKERAILSDSPEAPNHILIEGDNLEALTALSYTHEGKIDVIYIDPPYNTGNKDFSYNDSFVDSEDAYRHSKWLSFMSRRLKLAKRLLSDKGVIFISIDDNEQANLKLLCDEIFSSGNFVANMIWKSKSGGANDSSSFGVDHEYVLCFAKNSEKLLLNNDKGAIVTTSYNKVDEKGRRYALDRLDKQSLGYQQSLDFPIMGPDGKEYIVEHKDPLNKKARWRWGQDTVKERYAELVFIYPYVYTKNYEKEDGQKPRSIMVDERFGRTRTGSTDLASIIGKQNIFSYPKPIKLLKFILDISTKNTSTILDFFAGSGTTLHATMQLNAEDGGMRKCILVTNNENNNICEEITYERNKRVINGYTTPKGEKVEGLKNNSLRYYKTKLMSRERTIKNMRALMAVSTELVCIKNDLYAEQEEFFGRKLNKDVARYFDDRRQQMLIVYNEQAVESIIEVLREVDVERRIKIYLFSNNGYAYNDNFEEVIDKVELCALPVAIYNAYEYVLPRKKEENND